LPASSVNQRLQFALPFLYETGLRLSELVAATTDDLHCERSADAGDAWWLSVIGKGGRLREVPVAACRIAQLRAYLRARGLPDDPQQAAGAALLGAATDRAERTPWARLGPSIRPRRSPPARFIARSSGSSPSVPRILHPPMPPRPPACNAPVRTGCGIPM
jgi:integrase